MWSKIKKGEREDSLIFNRIQNMKAIFMTDEELFNHTKQVERDFNRLYGEWDNERKYQTVLYEKLCYLKYLCKQRRLHI